MLLTTPLNSGTARVADRVEATLAEPVSGGGAEVLPSGSTLTGTVTAAEDSGKVKGPASITVHFTRVTTAGREVRSDIDAVYSETAEPTKGADATKIGIGAGAGAAIGGLLGGKGGAANGAAIGGGAGTAVVLGTKGKEVDHPAGARLTVRLRKELDVPANYPDRLRAITLQSADELFRVNRSGPHAFSQDEVAAPQA